MVASFKFNTALGKDQPLGWGVATVVAWVEP